MTQPWLLVVLAIGLAGTAACRSKDSPAPKAAAPASSAAAVKTGGQTADDSQLVQDIK